MVLALRAGTLRYRIAELSLSALFNTASAARVNKIRSMNRISLSVFSYLWGKEHLRTFLDFSPIRKFVDSCQLASPLGGDAKTKISVVIPCHPKDSALISIVLEGLEKNCLNTISEVIIVSPEKISNKIKTGLNLRFLTDDLILEDQLVDLVKRNFPNSQFGWVVQQVLKIQTSLYFATQDNILVLDSDTVLIKPTLFVIEGRQILNITREYHRQYVNQYQNYSRTGFDTGFSYVTHFQLWQREVITALWGGESIKEWLSCADLSTSSSISEYHTYGSFLVENFPHRLVYANWGNCETSRMSLAFSSYEEIRNLLPNARSVSIHSYS